MNIKLIQSKWDEILITLKSEYSISDVSFSSWLKPLYPTSIDDDDTLVLSYIPEDDGYEADQMALQFIKKKYSQPISIIISELFGLDTKVKLRFEIGNKNNLEPNADSSNINIQSSNYINSNLNQKYTFDNFVVGGNNRFTRQASLAVAESPGDAYNPLYIYGGPGLGKTHLLHAIGNFVLQQNPEKKVLYVTTEQFTNEVIDGIKAKNVSPVREKFRSVDVLLIDDIQFIIGKEGTQEEFFNTFNTLSLAGKQIVITSDKPPKEMETLEDRIRSRFEMGLMADIGYPDYETRMAILKNKVESEQIEIDNQILNYIAENIKSNIRELEGALNKLIAYSNLEKVPLTMDIAEKELQNIITPDKPRELTPQLIIEVVCEHYDISMEKMLSKDRSKPISMPRQIAMYLCKTMTNCTLDGIGKLLNGRDHTTVLHGYNKIEEDIKTNEQLAKDIETIKKKINPN
ncbi:MAG: chromosomal replication initiator protein DnaA [Lachnospiraceae bacterium]|nr:chromosomal replication initiator protein DnaA [Lachnospiraceae bacterium]